MNSENKKDLIKLISIAKKKPKEAIKREKLSDLEEIRKFIDDNSILPHGTSTIPAALIYLKYGHWCKINGVYRRSPSQFFKQFKNYFNKKPNSKNSFYYLHPAGWDLTLEAQQYANEEYKKLFAEKKKSKIR